MRPPMKIEQVTIVGPGLLGASLAMALRNRDACERIVVWASKPGEACGLFRFGLV